MVDQALLQKIIISPHISIRAAANVIQEAEIKFLLVCDEKRRLVGTMTDGDIRRAVLASINLDGPVETIMNRSPKVAKPGDSISNLRAFMRASVIRHIPRVDEEGRIVGLVLLDAKEDLPEQKGAVVLMAGGRGSRLMPLTQNIPKPLLRVGSKPVIERQIEQLIDHGFRRFFISINYLGRMLEEHFGDGSRLGVKISYLREQIPLGTAGALSLLKPQNEPFIVLNGDIISDTHFSAMMTCFEKNNVLATMAVREYCYTVPFGCVTLRNGLLDTVEEKPICRHLINAGIYVFSPEVLRLIPSGVSYDMPQLFQDLKKSGCKVNTFLISDEWMDIGHKEDLMLAQKLFSFEDEIDS